MPAKPLTRAQQKENAAFLRQLRRTGNACAAARALGLKRDRFNQRRLKHPAFAAKWEAMLALAHAELVPVRGEGPAPSALAGEAYISASKTGRFQLRVTRPGMIDHAGRQRFLAALSATANVALSAAAAGIAVRSLYFHRQHNPGFAREWKLALQMGYDRLELALLESAKPESFADDDWRRNDPPAIPPMTVNQALQLLRLHQKQARLDDEPLHMQRLRPGETRQARTARLVLMYEHRQERDAMAYRIAEAERLAGGEPTHSCWNPGELPDLAQVTGWSRAQGKAPADQDRALFGGWRIKDIPEGKRGR